MHGQAIWRTGKLGGQLRLEQNVFILILKNIEFSGLPGSCKAGTHPRCGLGRDTKIAAQQQLQASHHLPHPQSQGLYHACKRPSANN